MKNTWRRKRSKNLRSHEIEAMEGIVNRALAQLDLDEEGLTQSSAQDQLTSSWTEIVGADIARHAQPHRIQNGILTIRVDSPVWHQELKAFGQKTLLQTLKKHFSFIKGLRFRIGSLDNPEKP
jgi:predicted nucleic acid-binding Zn ribbon protein